VLAASQQLLLGYWKIGGLILKYQQEEGWGAKVIDRLGGEFRHAFPGMSGFSARNLGYMKKFVESSLHLILQQGVAKLPPGTGNTPSINLPEQNKDWESRFLSSPLAQITWSHHVILLDKFLLELGQGFAFVGRQYPLNVGDSEFAIDLLFYHIRLRCYVVSQGPQVPFPGTRRGVHPLQLQ
jgi:predicted nuclease of restriction endonuclease-like (RecB) superfamily